jgi:hypothetical protein
VTIKVNYDQWRVSLADTREAICIRRLWLQAEIARLEHRIHNIDITLKDLGALGE